MRKPFNITHSLKKITYITHGTYPLLTLNIIEPLIDWPNICYTSFISIANLLKSYGKELALIIYHRCFSIGWYLDAVLWHLTYHCQVLKVRWTFASTDRSGAETWQCERAYGKLLAPAPAQDTPRFASAIKGVLPCQALSFI